ncbi:MAG TPA: sigma-70 family RNA polymerase sigma factor [Acidimicrobiia bacterium]|nr:sigma-70 family RNA polymerase sigma factor [Acidimicrobiia bacterium]
MVETEERDLQGQALDGVFRQESARMWRALFASTGDREIAADAVAEAFAQAMRRGDAIRDPRRWVWKAAYRIAAGSLAERSRRHVEGPADRPTWDTPTWDTEPAWDLRAALMRLSARQRDAVVLHHYAGYSTREVASMISSTPAAVRVHLVRGRRRLRELLGEVHDA